MRINRKNNIRQIIFFLITFLLIGFAGCLTKEQKKEKSVTIKIFSPTDCQYTFLVTKDRLHVESFNISYSQEKKAMDTLLLKFDTVFTTETQKIISNNIDSIPFRHFKVEKREKNDAYQYEIYSNDKLLGRGWCCDTTSIRLLKTSIPYIDLRSITCSDFFDVMSEIKL